MDGTPAVMWTCLLGVLFMLVLPPGSSFATSTASPTPPRLIGCVFIERKTVTCHWEPGDATETNYTLSIQMMSDSTTNSPTPVTCSTSTTGCTVQFGGDTVRAHYCITVTAHSWNISSKRRCQPGRKEVELFPAYLTDITAHKSPKCLNVKWIRPTDFAVSEPEIMRGTLNSQVEFTTEKQEGQLNVQVKNETVTNLLFQVCDLRPNTAYKIRLRHRYQGPESPWSSWSNQRQGRTGEGAPSAAPVFWRQVNETATNGQRLTSLLWKPLLHSLANGKVLFYNVTCQTESAQVLSNLGSCINLTHTSTSCSLHLPLRRCSCSLTASTSAGASPAAQLWLLGASETEPPPPSHVNATPLNNSSLEVRWAPPIKRLVSGFVVEWLAVRASSILHWEKLNSSCTTLVITEGIRPMERYAVSVRALYDEREAGKNSTHFVYAQQGTPSAGPTLRVKRLSGSTLELSWSPVPVELRRGFLLNYTLYYTTGNQTTSVNVSADADHHTLENLLPGNYNISMRARTDAGFGEAGSSITVTITEGSEVTLTVVYVVLPLVLTSLALMLLACLAQTKIVKQKLCQNIPDPSNSTLSHWAPRTTLQSVNQLVVPEKPEIKSSEVILLRELQNVDPDQDESYESVCIVQTHSSHQRSPLLGRLSEKMLTKAKTTSVTDLSTCPYIYSDALFSQPVKNLPTPFQPSSYCQSNGWQHSTVGVNDVKLQLGGASVPSDLHLSPPDEQETFRFFPKQHQSPVSFSDFSSTFHSSVFPSCPAEVSSLKHPLSHSTFNSVRSLLTQPNTFTDPSALSDNFTTSRSPFLQSAFVDLSYCPVECDPYISTDA